MRRAQLYIILFVSLFAANTYAKKNIPERERPPFWIKKEARTAHFPSSKFFVQFDIKENVKRKNLDTVKVELIKELKRKLSEQIITFVSSESLLLQSESSKYGHHEFYTNQITTSSTNIFYNSKPELWYDKRSNILYGLFTVKKKDLGKKYQEMLLTNLLKLEKELRDYDTTKLVWSIQNDIKSYNKRLKEQEKIQQVILATNMTVKDTINNLFSSIKLHLVDLDKVVHSAEMEEKIRNAQKLLVEGEYEEAYKAFKLLSIELPNDQRIINGIAESKNSIEQYYLFKINKYVKQDEYDEALDMFERLFRLLPDTRSKHQNEFYELEQQLFDHLCRNLDALLITGTVYQIKEAYDQLTSFKFINKEKYSRYKTKVDNAIADHYYREALADYNNKEFYSAITSVNKAIKLNARNSQYRDLHERAADRIYRMKLRELKNTRHHIMAFQFGGGVQTHKTFVNEFIDDNDTRVTWMPSFSFGLYAKYGIKSNVNIYGRDHSKSNLIGLQYTFVNPKWQYSFAEDFIKKELDYWQEIEFVIGFGTNWLFETGLANNRLSTDIDIKNVNFYTASLVRRFYTHPVELTLELKTYVTSGWDFYPVLKMGIYFDMNMIRKISHNDKKRLKDEISRIN
jgi:tetratricopeptide (TPR) repeat protein